MSEKESFVFYREYKEALDELKTNKQKLQFYELITEYTFYNTVPKNTDKTVLAMFKIIKKKLDSDNKNYFNYMARRNSKYKKWREEVLKRDKKICQRCGISKNLVAHHIVPFSENKDLRYDISNGITLCQNCHREVHKNAR